MTTTKRPLSALFLFIGFTTAACAAPPTDDDAATSAEALSERKIVEVESYVFGEAEYGADAASRSFRAACDAWGREQREVLGATFLDHSCGDGEDLTPGASTTQIGGVVKARLVVELEAGAAPVWSRTMLATGKSEYRLESAAKAWAEACRAETIRARELFGDRLLFATCAKPENVTPSASTQLLAGDHRVLLRPAAGNTVAFDVPVRGKAEYDADDAHRRFGEACAALGARLRASAGDHLVSVDCGAPTNATTSAITTAFAATAHVEVTSGDARVVPVVSGGFLANSEGEYREDDAHQVLAQRCAAADDLAKELFGDRFVASGCGEATNLTPTASKTVLRAAAKQVVLPAGATKIALEHWVAGAAEYGIDDAQTSLGSATVEAVRAQFARTGAARIEGFEVGEPENLTPSGSKTLLGSTVKVLVGVDVPAGAIAPLTSTDRVRGEAEYADDAALASWSRACADALDRAKTDHGERFLAGACPKPTAEGHGSKTSYASDVTVWLLP